MRMTSSFKNGPRGFYEVDSKGDRPPAMSVRTGAFKNHGILGKGKVCANNAASISVGSQCNEKSLLMLASLLDRERSRTVEI
jgi:hypothetical protein